MGNVRPEKRVTAGTATCFREQRQRGGGPAFFKKAFGFLDEKKR
jgi:hypothetical protein